MDLSVTPLVRLTLSAGYRHAGNGRSLGSHRLSTVRTADRIVTLDRGRLVEDGSHDALIKTGGRYASLHRLQGGLHEAG